MSYNLNIELLWWSLNKGWLSDSVVRMSDLLEPCQTHREKSLRNLELSVKLEM